MGDPVRKHVPSEAFIWPDRPHINLGSFSLPSPSDIEAATRLLGSLDLGSILQELRRNIRKRDDSDAQRHLGEDAANQPLNLSVTGLKHLNQHMHGTHVLHAKILDPENILG